MKLLKFVNSDAPHTLADVQLRNTRLVFPGKRGTPGGAKAWTLDAAPSTLQGGYWLLDDNNNPVCAITDVMLAMPETYGSPTSFSSPTTSSGSSQSTVMVGAPQGVADSHVEGIDFRSKMGRQLERERATYGATSKVASKSARTMMDAEAMTEKRQDRMKRDREAVAEAIENNDVSVVERKGSKRAKK